MCLKVPWTNSHSKSSKSALIAAVLRSQYHPRVSMMVRGDLSPLPVQWLWCCVSPIWGICCTNLSAYEISLRWLELGSTFHCVVPRSGCWGAYLIVRATSVQAKYTHDAMAGRWRLKLMPVSLFCVTADEQRKVFCEVVSIRGRYRRG